MAINLPTSHVVAPADPNAEGTNSGMNAGSCFPGIGICATGLVNPKLSDWSMLDQAENARIPQLTQPIGWGGDSIVTGQEAADLPDLLVVDYVGADFNDTAAFAVADSAIAISKGDVYDSVSGAILVSDLPVATVAGDRIWGAVPVV